MGNKICSTIKTKRKAKKPNAAPLSSLNLQTILKSYVPPFEIKNGDPLYACKICCEPKPTSDSFSVEGCNHFYCTKCTLKYIVSKLQNNILNLACPEYGCPGVLNPHYCKPILPKNVLLWWEKALCESVIPEKDKFYCPFNDCSALLLFSDGEKGRVVRVSNCPHCKRNFCVQCKAPWHNGFSCERFQNLKNKNDILMLDLAKRRKWKRCPNCKHYVEKQDGCNDMTCRCQHRFCYNCGTSLSNHLNRDCYETQT